MTPMYDCDGPGPTTEELCAANGHAYYGDAADDFDGVVGSCYCGAQPYPAGGSIDKREPGQADVDRLAVLLCCGEHCADGPDWEDMARYLLSTGEVILAPEPPA